MKIRKITIKENGNGNEIFLFYPEEIPNVEEFRKATEKFACKRNLLVYECKLNPYSLAAAPEIKREENVVMQYNSQPIYVSREIIKEQKVYMYGINRKKYPGVTHDIFAFMIHDDISCINKGTSQPLEIFSTPEDNQYLVVVDINNSNAIYQEEIIEW